MKSTLNILQTTEKFFQPLTKHPVRTIAISIIIGVVLVVGIDIGIAEVVRQNSYDIHMLASELIIERGPEYANEGNAHAEMIRKYTDHLEQRHFAAIIRVLYPDHSPRKALASALSGIEKASKGGNQEEAKEAIWQAGLASHELYRAAQRFPRSPLTWFRSEVVSEDLLMDLDEALSKSHELSDKLEKEHTTETALNCCRVNRRTILLLFLARLGYDNEENIKSFLNDVERARDCTVLLAESIVDKRKQELLRRVAESEDRRVKILEAMLNDNMDSVREHLKQAIEAAFIKEKGNANEYEFQ